MTPRTLSILAVLLFIGVAYCSGDANGSARRDAEHAEAVAKVKRAYADSIADLVVQQDDEKRRVVDSVKRAGNTRIAAAERGTDRALASSRAALATAGAALRDTGAAIAPLRAALEGVTVALQAVSDSLLNERAVHQTALRQRDSTHEARVGALRKGFDDTRAADSTAYESFKVSMQKQLAAARPGFLRKWGERVLVFGAGYLAGR